MAIPLTTAIALASAGASILDKIFGGGNKEYKNIPMPSVSPPYTSPYLGEMDAYLKDYLEGMLNAFISSGWGMPPELRKFFPKTTLSKLQNLAGYTSPAWGGFLQRMIPPEWGANITPPGGGYLGPPIPNQPPRYLGPPVPNRRRK